MISDWILAHRSQVESELNYCRVGEVYGCSLCESWKRRTLHISAWGTPFWMSWWEENRFWIRTIGDLSRRKDWRRLGRLSQRPISYNLVSWVGNVHFKSSELGLDFIVLIFLICQSFFFRLLYVFSEDYTDTFEVDNHSVLSSFIHLKIQVFRNNIIYLLTIQYSQSNSSLFTSLMKNL